jgi:hypothetical protein
MRHPTSSNPLEHLPCDGDLGHLQDNIAAMAHSLRVNLNKYSPAENTSYEFNRNALLKCAQGFAL